MKNLLKFGLAMLLVSVLALSVGAAEWITKDVTSKLDEAPAWYVEDDAVELEVWDMGDTNANSSASGADGIYPSGYVFLKAKGLGNFEVPFDVEESGNYNIGFVLMAWKKSVPRSTTFAIDGSEAIYVCYDYADEDQYSEQFLTGPTMYLEKGEHTLTLALGEDFDDTNVKSLYFDKFIYAPAGDAAAAPAAAAPAAAAFTTYTEYPEMTGTELVYATGDMDMLSGYDAKGGIGVDLFNLASGGTAYCLKRDTSVWYDFEVSEKTDVTFYVGYVARDGSNRGLDYAVDDPNGEKRVFMDLVESAEQQWVSATFTVDAGKHTFYLYAPTGMDDSTLKSCDVYTIELYGTPAAGGAAAEAPAASGFAPVGEVKVPFATPTVDGVINAGEYPNAALVIDASNATAGGWVGEVPAANSIELYCAWDADNLYISGNVTDPVFNTSTEGAYDGDSFQVSLNVNNIFETVDASSRAIFYSWGVQDDGTIDVIRQESAVNDTIADAGMGAVTDKGWTFEVALPIAMLAEDASLKSGEDIVIEAGTSIGGLFCYLDKDDIMALINAYATSATETVGWDPAAHGLTFVLEEDLAAKAAAEAEAAAKAAAEAEAAAKAAAEAEAAAKAAAEAEAAAQAAAEAEAAAKAEAEAEAKAEAEQPAETVETAPQTFDFGIVAAVSAIVSLMGFTLTKKR